MSRFDSPHTGKPKTQLLGNGRYSLMVTNSGGGYSQWGDFEITRWRSDRTRDPWGHCCYIHDADSDRLWSNTYHPTDGKVETYSASFALDRAVFRRIDNGIEAETEVVVSSEDDVEIRRITLINRSVRTRRLDLTSYIELVPRAAQSGPPASGLQQAVHPHRGGAGASTRSLPTAGLAERGDPPIFVAHRFTREQAEDAALRFETDRRRFIGRGRTLENPMGVSAEPSGSQGFVLDPILSLRQSLTLGPGERVQVSLVVAAGETREASPGPDGQVRRSPCDRSGPGFRLGLGPA